MNKRCVDMSLIICKQHSIRLQSYTS